MVFLAERVYAGDDRTPPEPMETGDPVPGHPGCIFRGVVDDIVIEKPGEEER